MVSDRCFSSDNIYQNLPGGLNSGPHERKAHCATQLITIGIGGVQGAT